MRQEHKELPTGKTICRQFDDNECLTEERHTYGMLDIGITMEFKDGVKSGEMYFVKRKLASRKRYEKARADYSDMPPPDQELEDFGGDLLKDLRAERRQRAKAAQEHVPDSEVAAEIDSFCQTMLTTGKLADGKTWIESTDHTLGEYPHAKSRSIISKLLHDGAKQVHVCDIDCYDDNQENTDHLVIELPVDADRKPVFRELARLASLQGYNGEFDNGQRYAYVKLN
jgi:hypothetical protein